jgi:DNA-binding NtrC family response regulator
VSDDDVRVLVGYHWPGNVREMAAVMDRAVLIGQGMTLNVAAALGQDADRPAPSPVAATALPARGPIDPLDVVIRRHIESALRETRGRVEGPNGAARLLAINPHTLRARMRKLRIDWNGFRDTPPDSPPHGTVAPAAKRRSRV